MARLAGEVADGVIFNAMNSIDWVQTVGRPATEEGRERSGLARFETGLLRVCALGHDISQAYDLARPALAAYFQVPYFDELLRAQGFAHEAAAGSQALAYGDWPGQVRAVSDAMVDALCLAGTQEAVRSKLAAYDGVVDWIWLSAGQNQPRDVAREQTELAIGAFAHSAPATDADVRAAGSNTDPR
jgi:5,10-methylenetetrahydromethanopterin reductase